MNSMMKSMMKKNAAEKLQLLQHPRMPHQLHQKLHQPKVIQ
jgi:hypothetical protein